MTSSGRSGDDGTRACRTFSIALATGALLAAVLTAGCASEQPAGPREYLDERTAATITVAGESMVFACERPELGVNARDYVTLTAVDVNTSGKHATHLVGYAWSTLDKRAVVESDSRYELVADDRTLSLQPMPDGFRSIGVNEPPIPVPARSALPLTAPITRDQLQFLRDTPGAHIVRTRDGVQEPFNLWRGPGG
ncbi:MAG: hypothetical protein KA760_18085 [Steroidobacteraceae bacterium]|nr:hypothetical protein [Steroidobacteraceae bacterium]